MRPYLAHLDTKDGRHREHALEEHLREVGRRSAQYATELARAEGDRDTLAQWGVLLGIAHDLGKASQRFQERLRGSQKPVDHSTAGAQWLSETFGNAGRLLAYAVAGHHGGMPNGIDETEGSLSERLKKKEIKDIPEWDRAVLAAVNHPLALRRIPIRVVSTARQAFQIGFFVRMLFSCLVDADFLDTEAFFDAERAGDRSKYPELSKLGPRLDAHLKNLAAKAQPSRVDPIRAEILAECRAGSALDPGLFSLTVPTGGGKTLASLAFALDHARAHTGTHYFRRVIYAIPYTSIIEQTAGIFRDALGEDAVLEHHSNYDPSRTYADGTPTDPSDDSTRSNARRGRLASENWDAPLIVTTNVQFFESLFHNRPARCRRLHNIARSVVILDEAQMLPVDYLLPCLEALRELVLNYGVSVVLCTATQPALGRREDFPAGLEGVRELITDPADLARRMKRVSVTPEGLLHDATLAARISAARQALCVVNTRRHAARVFALLRETEGTFHLSANMCPAHRSVKLAAIRQRLKDGLPCRVVSTQLIEAGVDVDFPIVYRAAAGTDSVAQAAGRCNREWRQDTGHVHVFEVDAADLPPGFLRQAAEEGRTILRNHPSDPLSLPALTAYFEALYWRRGDRLDKRQIVSMFTEGAAAGNFAFRGVAELFQLIEDAGESLIVPWDDDARKLIKLLDNEEAPYWLLRKLQRYTISVPRQALNKLEAQGAVQVRQDRYRVLVNDRMYHQDVGLQPEIFTDPALLVI